MIIEVDDFYKYYFVFYSINHLFEFFVFKFYY